MRVALVLLAVPQLAREGLYWQFFPGYVLLLGTRPMAIGWVTAFSTAGRILKTFVGLGLAAVLLLAVAAWVFLLVPRLPALTGRYAVGTEIFRWVDVNRPEESTPDPEDKRNVVVQAWYLIAPSAGGGRSTYIDGSRELPTYVTLIPRFVFWHFDRIDSYGVTGAPRRTGPVVVFSPGSSAARAFYTGLVTGLASNRFVVLAINHPYETAVTELADARVVTTVDSFRTTIRTARRS